MKKGSILIAACLLAGLSASAQQASVNLQLTGFEDGAKFYLKDNDQDLLLDSALVKDGQVTLSAKMGTPKNYWVYSMYNKKFYYVNATVGRNDKIKITGDRKDFPFKVKLSGSKHQETANVLRTQIADLLISRDSVVQILMPLAMGTQSDSTRELRKPLSKRMKDIDNATDSITRNFIAKYPNSFTAQQELYYLRSKYTKDQLTAFLAGLAPEFKEGPFASRLSAYLRVGDAVKKGQQYYDFEASDVNGKKHKLSDFAGKYILLDFTETYCGPCILAVEDLKNIQKKYSDKINIVSFYADKTKKTMLEGIKRDKPTWTNLWDGQGTYGDTLLKYGVQGYPTFVIIDPEGKIVSMFSGYGKDDNGKGNLENEVEKLVAAVR